MEKPSKSSASDAVAPPVDASDAEALDITEAEVDALVAEAAAAAPVTVPAINTKALDTALTQLRTLHIDSSTSEGVSLLYVKEYVVDALDELRALLLQR